MSSANLHCSIADSSVPGKYDGYEGMVTSRISVEDVVAKGFEELINNKDEHIKILVTPKKSSSQ